MVIALSKMRTHDEFVDLVHTKHPNIMILSRYCGAQGRVECECEIDGYRWSTSASSLLHGSNCPRCSGKERYTLDDVKEKVRWITPSIEIVSTEYMGIDKPLDCVCNVCSHKFRTSAGHLFNGSGCPKCAGVARKDTESFKLRLSHINPSIEVLGEYVNNKTPVLCMCKVCGHKWYGTPNAMLSHAHGCPKCNLSRGERRISSYLDKNNIKYSIQQTFEGCYDKQYLPFDFYLPAMNVAIEYDGQQHFSPISFGVDDEDCIAKFETTKLHDEIKTAYCRNHNIKLIRIPYTDFNKIEQILNKLIVA